MLALDEEEGHFLGPTTTAVAPAYGGDTEMPCVTYEPSESVVGH